MEEAINPNLIRTPIKTLDWQTLEYEHIERSSNWFWLIGLVSLLGIIISVVLLNFLFAVVLLIAGFTVMLYGARKPELVNVSINRRGVQIKNQIYPYANIAAFALRDDEEPFKLILHIDRIFLPHVTVSLEDVNPEMVREYLSEFLPEEPFAELFLEIISERLGF